MMRASKIMPRRIKRDIEMSYMRHRAIEEGCAHLLYVLWVQSAWETQVLELERLLAISK